VWQCDRQFVCVSCSFLLCIDHRPTTTTKWLTRLTIFILFPCSSLPFFFFSGAILSCHAPIHPYARSFARTLQDKTLYTYTAGVATQPLLATLHWATQFTHRKGRKRMNYCDNSIVAIAVPTVFTSRSTAATIATYRGNQCFVNTVHVDWRSVVHHWGYLFWHIRVGCQPHYRDTACWWSRWCVSWHCPWHRCCS